MKTRCAFAIALALWFASGVGLAAQQTNWKELESKPDVWFQNSEGKRLLANVLSWQSPQGSWPKGKDTVSAAYSGVREELKGTFDNNSTIPQLRLLARAFTATKDQEYRAAFLKGLDHILQAQYANGGWPQYFPPGTGYARHITFNDDAFARLMEFVREVGGAKTFDFVDAGRRQAARTAFDRGIHCVLKCQVVVDGKLTAWCAQHDEVSFEPRSARSYELVSLSGAESGRLLQLLMSLDQPGTNVAAAIKAGVAWFANVQIKGLRQERREGNKVMVKDEQAPPLWARFYEIGSNRPMFSGRDGVKKYDIAEIESERRNGYAWYGDWGLAVAREYERWAARNPIAHR